jgi:hypothetical protein
MATKEVQNPAPTTTLEGKRNPRATIWLWLTVPIAFLVAIAAGVGFFIEISTAMCP